MKKLVGLWGMVALVAMGVAACPAAPSAEVEAMVIGGGTADFQDTPNAVNKSGYTQFSVAANVYTDGSAAGEFLCQVPAVVTIVGEVLGGSVSEDGRLVTVYGLAHGYDHTVPLLFTDLPFVVTFRAGGPGAGGFDYRDESGFFGPGQFDTELVRRGMIVISD